MLFLALVVIVCAGGCWEELFGAREIVLCWGLVEGSELVCWVWDCCGICGKSENGGSIVVDVGGAWHRGCS